MTSTDVRKSVILVVDDTEDIRELLSVILRKSGFNVLTAGEGLEMDQVLTEHDVDLIVLDSMMPGEDGLSICKRLQLKFSPPIIMLSAKGQDTDRIRGLDLGAEDYIAKPFNPAELVSRIRVVLRRVEKTNMARPTDGILEIFGWRLDTQTRKLTSPDHLSLALSSAEYAILRVLIDNPDRPLKREHILEQMAALYEHSTVRALDTLVSRLRRRLNESHPNRSPSDELIRTVYGIGYMLRPPRR